MLAKTIKYTDFNEVDRTETFYFHLTKAELISMNLSVDGGMQEMLERIVETRDGKQIVEVFKNILRASYGERLPDGRFVKTDEVWERFFFSQAYSEMFVEIATNADAAADFIKAVIPKDLAKEYDAAVAAGEIPGIPETTSRLTE